MPVALPAPIELSSPSPGLPCWPLPPSLPAVPPDFEDEPPAPPEDPAPLEPAPDELALPPPDPTPLVDEEPPERFDSLGALPPVTVGGASEYW